MAELLIVLMMAFNLWMVIYLTWERREENVPKEDKEKDVGAPERSGDIMGKSLFRMPERKPQAAAPMSNATVQAPGEEEMCIRDRHTARAVVDEGRPVDAPPVRVAEHHIHALRFEQGDKFILAVRPVQYGSDGLARHVRQTLVADLGIGILLSLIHI